MFEGNWEQFIQNLKEVYKKIGHITCPIFKNENIYFNHYGLSHLMYKDRKKRPPGDIQRRIILLSQALDILKQATEIHHHDVKVKEKSIAYFWEIRQHIIREGKKRIIRIVLRRLNQGTIHFFSVYDT